MALFKYMRAAFLNHWNLLGVIAGSVFGFLTGRPDIVLPLVGAVELGYLGLLGTHPKFQAYVDAEGHREARARGRETSEKMYERITSLLPQEYLDRYEKLRGRCLDLRGIARDLHRSDPLAVQAPLEKMQLAGLDRLLWIYVRLLYTEWSLKRFFERTSESGVREDIARLEAKIEKYEADPEKPGRRKALKALEDNLATSRTRLENLEQARQNHEIMQLEIDRLENKIRTLSEIAVSRQEPGFISDQVDAVASSMLETERTMNELQFATGLSTVEENVPELLRAGPKEVIAEEEEDSSGPLKRRRRR